MRPRLTALTICLLLFLLAPTAARAEAVWLVKGKATGPSELAARGFTEGFLKSLRVVSLEQGGMPKTPPPEVAVALGKEALKACLELPPSVPIIILLTFNPGSEPLGGRSWVAIDPSVSTWEFLDLLDRSFPSLPSVGLFTSDSRTLEEARGFVGRIKVNADPVKAIEQVPALLPDLLSRSAGLLLPLDPKVTSKETIDLILQKAKEAKKPVFAFNESIVRQGGYLGMVASYEEMGAQAARLAVQGPAALRGRTEVVLPQKTFLIANPATVQALGMPLPSGVKEKAREIQ